MTRPVRDRGVGAHPGAQPVRDRGAEGGPGDRDRGSAVVDFALIGDVDVKALDGVSLTIKPGEKVGLCGRTGR